MGVTTANCSSNDRNRCKLIFGIICLSRENLCRVGGWDYSIRVITRFQWISTGIRVKWLILSSFLFLCVLNMFHA
ncbi:hypothetical protein A167_03067 [Alcanivorax sp. S71-1-4]|nr:hypothetical protein A167_03067 [Alcanivorax sp. S71-1-4]